MTWRWIFHSLWMSIQLLFSFMLADDEKPMRIWKNYAKVLIARKGKPDDHCADCKKQYGK